MSMVDTSPHADARYQELLRRMPPERRLEAAMRLSQAVRELALAGIRASHPAADEHELRVRLAVRLYGRSSACKLFGQVPDDATRRDVMSSSTDVVTALDVALRVAAVLEALGCEYSDSSRSVAISGRGSPIARPISLSRTLWLWLLPVTDDCCRRGRSSTIPTPYLDQKSRSKKHQTRRKGEDDDQS